MKYTAVDGVIIRSRDSSDHDRYLTILTPDMGRITVLSKGSRSLKNGHAALTQPFTYGNYEIYRKGDLYILTGGTVRQSFYGITGDLSGLCLANYLCDVAFDLTGEGEEAAGMTRLLLNSLYAIANHVAPLSRIKGTFEWRAAVRSGYAPELGGCRMCGRPENELFYLDVMNGSLICPECLQKQGKNVGRDDFGEMNEAEILCPLTPAVCAALRYVATAPQERILSFSLNGQNDPDDFAKAAETYLLSHLGRGFDSLHFYETVASPKKAGKGSTEL